MDVAHDVPGGQQVSVEAALVLFRAQKNAAAHAGVTCELHDRADELAPHSAEVTGALDGGLQSSDFLGAGERSGLHARDQIVQCFVASFQPGAKVGVATRQLLFESFEDPADVTSPTDLTDPTGWENISPRGTRAGLGDLTSTTYTNYSGDQAAWLKFDDGMKPGRRGETTEFVKAAACPVAGNTTLWKKGVSGTALAFDGYFSKVTLPRDKAPAITDVLTLQAWVALGAYPWNDAGIVQ